MISDLSQWMWINTSNWLRFTSVRVHVHNQAIRCKLKRKLHTEMCIVAPHSHGWLLRMSNAAEAHAMLKHFIPDWLAINMPPQKRSEGHIYWSLLKLVFKRFFVYSVLQAAQNEVTSGCKILTSSFSLSLSSCAYLRI